MNIKAIQLEPPKSGAWENANLRKVQRFLLLKTALHTNIEEFLKKINLLSESIFEFNEKNDELVLERQEFPENKYEKSVVENPEFGLLNNSAQGLFENLIIYYETAFYKFDVYEFYSKNQDSFKHEIQQQITDFCQKNYRTIVFPMVGSIERLQKDCLRDMKTALMIKDELNKTPTVEAYIEAYKSFQKEFVEKFNQMIVKRFEKGISEVFVSPYRQKLKESIKETVISDNLIQKHFRNRSQFRKDVYKELENMFSRYFIEGEITELFDIKVFHNTQNIVTLFCIIILTDYQETDDAKKQAYLNILQRLYDMFMGMYGEVFTELPQYLELIKMQNKTPEIVQKLNQALEENKQKWSNKMNQSENLAAMMSLFLAFNFVSEEGLDKSYTCHTRYMLKCAFRNLKNGTMQFTNFQVLCCMESLIMEYAKNWNNSQVKMDGSGSLVVNDVLERIRSTSVSSIAEHLEHEGQLSALTDKFDKAIVRPEKFFFEKISDPKVRSKAIIICVSGFISEDHTKTGEWKYVCEAYPDTEVIAVNWKSNAIASIGENMWSNVKEKFNTGGNILSKIWKGGMAVYRSGRDAWSKTYEQAVLTGRYLAHFLANTELFQGHVVNLMGFSLGTLVIMSCVWELEKMNRYDIIYDVLLMGGVAHIGNFHTSMLKAVGHRVTNCYCSSDYILSYVLSHVNQNINPIGLGPILWEDNKVGNVDVTHVANGHIRYRGVLGEILARTDFNEDLEYLINQ